MLGFSFVSTFYLNTMDFKKIVIRILWLVIVDGFVIKNSDELEISSLEDNNEELNDTDPDNVFNGVYSECFLHLSYACLQKKTLLYLKELNNLSEVSVIGDYVKFVKLNTSMHENKDIEDHKTKNTEELAFMIDKAIDNFFNNHILKFSALGKDISMPQNVEEFVGRKKRKGGGGGGGGHGGGDDGGKKKMMMMAMMCMKMKLMMMVPAMMGMMGMMSFKGMMFSMMSFMLSKMMLLMKLLEKKGGGGGLGGGGGGDGGWAAGGGGAGAWMPAGGQDYGGGGGGGYDANGQWQSRSIFENEEIIENKPIISYVKPVVRFNSNVYGKTEPLHIVQKLNNEVLKMNQDGERGKPKSRKKRGIIDLLQNSYIYWINRILGGNGNRRTNYPKFKIVNGVKYVYYPLRPVQKPKMPKEIQTSNRIKTIDEGFKPIITAEDFNKGEIVEGSIESRMSKKKFHKMRDSMNDTVEDNPWE